MGYVCVTNAIYCVWFPTFKTAITFPPKLLFTKYLEVKVHYRSDSTLYQRKPILNPGFTFWEYLRFTLSLIFEKLGPLGFTFCVLRFCFWSPLYNTHWSVKQNHLLSYHLAACKSCLLYIPNIHVACPFRCILHVYLWPGFTHCFHFGFTLGLPE